METRLLLIEGCTYRPIVLLRALRAIVLWRCPAGFVALPGKPCLPPRPVRWFVGVHQS